MILKTRCLVLAAAVLVATGPASAADFPKEVDGAVLQVLAASGVPSASVAIVRDGRIAYVQAYGEARLSPRMAASPGMR
jgi:CubicO group peptidase (beta-lactamase class C family)